MNIKRCIVGYLQTNCYLLFKDDEVLIIDPGDEFDLIDEAIGNYNVSGVLITHSHDDHTGALDDLVNKYKCAVYDKTNLKEGNNTISNYNFKVIYTPGHIDDEVVYYFEKDKVMFVGDFIFKDSIGRMDLPGGNSKDMKDSLLNIINYPKDTIIYPGHGDSTTLDDELDNLNYYINIL